MYVTLYLYLHDVTEVLFLQHHAAITTIAYQP